LPSTFRFQSPVHLSFSRKLFAFPVKKQLYYSTSESCLLVFNELCLISRSLPPPPFPPRNLVLPINKLGRCHLKNQYIWFLTILPFFFPQNPVYCLKYNLPVTLGGPLPYC
jgi:hypothetical protein